MKEFWTRFRLLLPGGLLLFIFAFFLPLNGTTVPLPKIRKLPLAPSETGEKAPKSIGYLIRFSGAPALRSNQRRARNEDQHAQFKQDAEKLLGKSFIANAGYKRLSRRDRRDYIPLLGEYYIVFNGAGLGISSKEARALGKLSYVTGVYPIRRYKKVLHVSIPLIRANSAWQSNYTGNGVKIGIIDTGIDYTHPDLGGGFGGGYKVAGGYDFVNIDGDPMDDDGHGTHCAATAAGKGDGNNNNVYEPGRGEVWGVAPDAVLYAYKVLDSSGSGWGTDIIAGIELAVTDGIDVISMSLGGFPVPDDPMVQAVDNAVEAGVVAVVAAGNDGPFENTIGSPGTSWKCITIGASDDNDLLAEFSSRGPLPDGTMKPDVLAPGVEICAAQWADSYNDHPCLDNDHISISGTSMATPHVAGLAALLLQKNSGWTPLKVKYAIRATAVDLGYPFGQQGSGRVDALSAIQLSSNPPIAQLETKGDVAGLNIAIKGTASAGNFQSYQLHYSAGTDPGEASWSLITSSTSPVTGGTLGTWAAGNLEDDRYMLRLTVKGQEAGVVDYTIVNLDNLNIDFEDYAEFQVGKSYTVNGSSVIKNFSKYVLDYVKIKYHDSDSGFDLVGSYKTIKNSTAMVSNGKLGTLDLAGCPREDAYCMLRLRVYTSASSYPAGEVNKIIYLENPGGLQTGWPITLDSESTMSSLTVADVDNNNRLESSFCDGENFWWPSDGEFYMWSAYGQVMPGWPTKFEYFNGTYATPAMGDLDKDGYKELTITCGERLFIFNRLGQRVAFWNSNQGGIQDTTLADIDNNGDLEIIYCSVDAKIYVFNHDGQFFPGYPVDIGENIEEGGNTYNHAVGDVNGDGKLDIVFPTWAYKLYAYTLINGQRHTGFPIHTGGYMTGPIIADINGDGSNEILAAVCEQPSWQSRLYIWKGNGSPFPGWPKYIPAADILYRKQFPAVGDIDGDGDLEIFYTSWYGQIDGWHHNGTAVKGWPKYNTGTYIYTQPLLADITGDGKIDIITMAADDYRSQVYAWNNDGTLVDGFPKQILNNSCRVAIGTPAIADLDNDGDLELLARSADNIKCDGSNEGNTMLVYKVWDLPAPYNPAKMEWPMFLHDAYNTNCYTPAGAGGNMPPVVAVNEPSPGGTVSGIVSFTASASDDDYDGNGKQIKTMEFFLDGTDPANKLGEDSETPYQLAWDTSAVSDGTHTLYAVATEDVDSGTPRKGQVSISVTVYNNSGSGANIVLNLSRISFGAVLSGHQTSAQTLLIDNSGEGTLFWSVSASQGWLSCTPAAGDGAGEVSVSIDPNGLSAGTYNGTLTVSSPNAFNSPQVVPVTLTVHKSGNTSVPFGQFATPVNGSTAMGSVPVTGWALDDIGIESVRIYRMEGNNPVPIGDAVFVEGARPDVQQQHPGYPMNNRAGWGYMMLTNFLPGGGNGSFKIRAVARDVEGNESILGTVTIVCDNANAVKPFGAIETPGQGGTASGTDYRNWGWALTPPPAKIPEDGSTIEVMVNSVTIGHPVYNLYRKDVAELFPGYENSDGAFGYFDIDTTAYENGVHTIQWVVTDNHGNRDGIGSRYFSTRNTAGDDGSTNRRGSYAIDIPLSKIPVLSSESYSTREFEELKLQFDAEKEISGYMKTGDRLASLPTGSTLDTGSNTFYWVPSPGFIGDYELVFIEKDKQGVLYQHPVRVRIKPKY